MDYVDDGGKCVYSVQQQRLNPISRKVGNLIYCSMADGMTCQTRTLALDVQGMHVNGS